MINWLKKVIKQMELKIFKDYVKLRNKNNPYQEPNLDIWGKYIALSMNDFSATINKLPYKWDFLRGLIDKTGNIDRFFDYKRNGRDCDDFARAWFTWGVGNGYHCQEYIVSTSDKIVGNAHVIDVIDKDGLFWLCNYENKGPFTSEQKALDFMTRYPTYAKDMIYAKGIEK